MSFDSSIYANYHVLMTLPDFNRNWILGFFEADGSLHIIKDKKWTRCGFSFTQHKSDYFILVKIRQIMQIKSKVNTKTGNSNVYNLSTMSNAECIKFVDWFGTPYFGVSKMYGIKDFEFNIWCYALFNQTLSASEKLVLQSIIRKYRSDYRHPKPTK
jgi:hypothetical protein